MSEIDLKPYSLKLKGFKVYKLEEKSNPTPVHSRRDLYKICLIDGISRIQYQSKTFEHEGAILLFGTPHHPYFVNMHLPGYNGYACVFTPEFFENDDNYTIHHFPFLNSGFSPFFILTEAETKIITTIFQEMLSEFDSGYFAKDDLIRFYICMIIHEVLDLPKSTTSKLN